MLILPIFKVNFAPYFVAPEGLATVKTVANHVEHIATIAGKEHVGIGSDFDGIEITPDGLEDVSKYPALVSYYPHFLVIPTFRYPSCRSLNFIAVAGRNLN